MIGGFCHKALLDDPTDSEVIALVRKPILPIHRKLKVIEVKFDDFESEISHIHANDVYCCLGTTIQKTGSQNAFKKIDQELVVTVAELMKKRGAKQFLARTALGADKNSKVFYNRTKGEMQSALRELNYQCLHIIRPSLLLGPREEFRFGKKIAHEEPISGIFIYESRLIQQKHCT